MLLRLIVLIGFCAILYTSYRIIIRWQLAKVGQVKELDPLLLEIDLSNPTIVYFTTPMCAICKTTQGPAFERLYSLIKKVTLVKVDASTDPDSTQRWGVLSVPTIYILDKVGSPVSVNNGFVDENKLATQINAVHGIG